MTSFTASLARGSAVALLIFVAACGEATDDVGGQTEALAPSLSPLEPDETAALATANRGHSAIARLAARMRLANDIVRERAARDGVDLARERGAPDAYQGVRRAIVEAYLPGDEEEIASALAAAARAYEPSPGDLAADAIATGEGP